MNCKFPIEIIIIVYYYVWNVDYRQLSLTFYYGF